ncbi:MAG: hypothetical protein ACKVE4_10165 [Dissulfuribacterales bacterium]
MTKIFIGGSRKVTRLNEIIRKRISNIIDQNLAIYVGDANGADKAVQTFLSEKEYKNVSVFCSGMKCRNNVGKWKTVNIEVASELRGIKFYMAKDYEMAKLADYGFMLWDGKSAGTLNNVLNLLKLDKKTLIYFSPTKQFHTISSLSDLEAILKRCNAENLLKIDQKISYKKTTKDIALPSQMALPL